MHNHHRRKLIGFICFACLICLSRAFAQQPVPIEDRHNPPIMAWFPWIIVILGGLLVTCGVMILWMLRLKRQMASRTRNLETEIQERQQIEAALRASEERYRMLFEEAPLSLWEEDFSAVKRYLDRLKDAGVTDYHAYFDAHPDQIRHCVRLVNVVDVNQVTLTLYHAQSKAEFVGGLHHVIGEEAYTEVFREIMALAEGQTSFEIELHNRTFAEKHLHVQLKWVVAPGYEDTWERVLIAIVDITDRKRTEEALRESEERFRCVLNNSLDAAYRRNLQTDRYDYMSPVIEHVLGWSVEAMNTMDTQTVLTLVHPDDIPMIVQEIERTNAECGATGRATGKLEYRIRDQHGVYRWVGDTITVLADATGRPLYRLGMIRDISDRKQAEEMLRINEERYRKAQAMGHVGNWEYNLETTAFWGSDEAKRI